MREILFRGKRIDNGEWETGSLVYARMGTSEEQASIADKMTAYHTPVIPETVGQYTGLTDKNEKKIFEGDIVSGHLDDLFPDEESRYEIAWKDYGWHLTSPDGTLDTAEQNWVNQHFEVIGNIYDNPELMEVEK